eukprot:TRINITY_DN1375_c0_g1_i9.p1 TRINITY_DN1375_c0_g1~~TRINITY_DN1375_c0_g1_i9.p1  ORF type:complete len:119 (+),score=15.88 TRINITY_DN1375_c0_g1_i9:620-976(+)
MRFINDYRGVDSKNCSFISFWKDSIEHSVCCVTKRIEKGQEILTDYGIGILVVWLLVAVAGGSGSICSSVLIIRVVRLLSVLWNSVEGDDFMTGPSMRSGGAGLKAFSFLFFLLFILE